MRDGVYMKHSDDGWVDGVMVAVFMAGLPFARRTHSFLWRMDLWIC